MSADFHKARPLAPRPHSNHLNLYPHLPLEENHHLRHLPLQLHLHLPQLLLLLLLLLHLKKRVVKVLRLMETGRYESVERYA